MSIRRIEVGPRMSRPSFTAIQFISPAVGERRERDRSDQGRSG